MSIKMQGEVRALQRRVNTLEKSVEMLTEIVAELDKRTAKRGPGRPPKNETRPAFQIIEPS